MNMDDIKKDMNFKINEQEFFAKNLKDQKKDLEEIDKIIQTCCVDKLENPVYMKREDVASISDRDIEDLEESLNNLMTSIDHAKQKIPQTPTSTSTGWVAVSSESDSRLSQCEHVKLMITTALNKTRAIKSFKELIKNEPKLELNMDDIKKITKFEINEKEFFEKNITDQNNYLQEIDSKIVRCGRDLKMVNTESIKDEDLQYLNGYLNELKLSIQRIQEKMPPKDPKPTSGWVPYESRSEICTKVIKAIDDTINEISKKKATKLS